MGLINSCINIKFQSVYVTVCYNKKPARNLRLFLEDWTKISNGSEMLFVIIYLTQILNQHLSKLHFEIIDQKINVLLSKGRSSRPEMFCKNGVIKNLTKFTGKHIWHSLFLIIFSQLYQKRDSAQLFSCEFCEIFKNSFFQRRRTQRKPIIVLGNKYLTFSKYMKRMQILGLYSN